MTIKHPNVQFVMKNGKKSAVILPIKDYEELLEDIEDLAAIAKRKDEPYITLDELKRQVLADRSIKKRNPKKLAHA